MRRLALAAAIVPLLLGPAASASVVMQHDAKGDAPARYDIKRLRIRNGEHVMVRADVVNLKGGRTQIFGATFTAKQAKNSAMVSTVRHRDGTVTAKLQTYDAQGNAQEGCPVQARWLLKKDKVRVVFDRDCLRKKGTLHVLAYLGPGDGSSGDPADVTGIVTAY